MVNVHAPNQPLPVVAVMAQRLVRTVCKQCREPYTPLPAELQKLGIDPSEVTAEHTLYRAGGCEACFGSGYAGRWGIHELLRIDDEIRS